MSAKQWSTYQTAIFEAVKTGTSNLAINAVAGSGKTTTIVEAAKLMQPGDRVVFLAFNKHITVELQGRLPKSVDCMTIHSLGMKACGKGFQGKLKVDQYKMHDIIDDTVTNEQSVPGQMHSVFSKMVRQLVDLGRLTLTNFQDQDAIDSLIAHFDLAADLVEAANDMEVSIVWLLDKAVEVARRAMKRGLKLYEDNGIIDFTDMLWLPYVRSLPVPRYDVVMVDEAQDLSAAQAQLVLKAAGATGRVIAVGDPCQPPGTMIKVVRKPGDRWNSAVIEDVAIENLRIGDTVLSYCERDCHYYRQPVTGISVKPYDGQLVRVDMSDGKSSRYTLNHHCIISFEPLRDQYAVYMMRKGNQCRIGMSKVDQPSNRYSGPIARFQTEGADALWILAFYPTYKEAATMEQAISGRFGIPQLMFNGQKAIHDDVVEKAWKWIGDNIERGVDCLSFFGRDIRYPLLSATDKQWTKSLKRPIVTQASNIIDGCLMLPYNGRNHSSKADWQPVSVSRESYIGEVYSLNIEKYHTYVADSIATHNCQAIQGFAGAANDSFAQLVERTKAQVLPLSVCYRCPSSHLALARQIVPNIEAAPNAIEGSIETIDPARFSVMPRSGDLVICRTNAPLIGAALRLIGKGIQARVRGRNIGAQLAKLAEDASKIEIDPAVEAEGWRTAFETKLRRFVDIRIDTLMQRKHTEAAIESVRDQQDCLLVYLDANPTVNDLNSLNNGIEGLFADERASVWLSSIHRAKGLEADRVFVLKPDKMALTWKNQLAWQAEQEQNLRYVGLTRAKKALYFVEDTATETEAKPAA